MVRRFGPTLGAGVVLIEKESEKLITPAALGVTAYIGILEKGPLDELFRAKNKKEFAAKAGKRTPDSLVPDVAGHFYENSNGAGEIWLQRVTDGNEKKSEESFRGRQSKFQVSQMKIQGKSAGKWAGKKQKVVGQFDSVGTATMTLKAAGQTFQTDELKGAVLTLNGVSGKTYNVVSNTSADPAVITIDSDQDMTSDLNGSSDKLFNMSLVNSGRSVAILLKDGLEKPTTEFGMEVYEDGVKVKEYSNLDTNPLNARYFSNVINDDTSNNSIVVTDLFSGSHVADVRPSNFAGFVESATETTMNCEIITVSEAAALNLKMNARAATGANGVKDTLVLSHAGAGVRAVEDIVMTTVIPLTDDTLTVNGVVFIYKTTLTVPAVAGEILIGADLDAVALNTKNAINADRRAGVFEEVHATVSTVTVSVFADTAGLLGNAITLATSNATNIVLGAAVLSTGTDETWTITSSSAMPDVTEMNDDSITVTSGVAFAGMASNPYSMGFTLKDATRLGATPAFNTADTLTVIIEPMPDLTGGKLISDVVNDRRKKFTIASNTALGVVTVSPGSLMLTDGSAAFSERYIIEAQVELGAGLDGLGDISDSDFTIALDSGSSFVNELFGKNKGLVKLATPGNGATAVQKAGLSLAEALNYQYRVEITKTITDESVAEAYINDTIGKSDFGVTIFPSYADILDPDGSDGQLKRVPVTGMVHGREALVARNFNGYFKAAAGLDVTLPQIVGLPTGEKVLDEELLNPNGINIIKKKEGNFIIWGDRSMAIDPAFKFKHQREYLSHIENILRESFDFIIFALNNIETRASLNTTLTAFFRLEFTKGALFGATQDDAFRIKIDDENNTLLTMASGDLNAEITLRIVDTVERFVITIGKAGIFEDLAA